MIILFAVLLYTHPTLSDSWLMWALLLATFAFKVFQMYGAKQTQTRLNGVIATVNMLVRKS